MNTLAQLLDPVLLFIAAALPFGVGAIIFVLHRRDSNTGIMLQAPLSWVEPIEIRIVLFLLFGAIWGVIALLPRALFAAAPAGSGIAAFLLTLVVIAFVFDIAFVYAAAGTLLQAALGTRGRPPFWFSRYLAPIDAVVMALGDLEARLLLRQAPSSRAVRDEALDFEADHLEREPDGPVRSAPGRRASRRDAALVARERLDAAIAAYEHRLTPDQTERYLLMKEIMQYLTNGH